MIPSILYIRLFSHCNSNCVMCRCRKNPAGLANQTNEIKRAVKLLADAGVEEIRFTGGEPLLYEDLEEIIALFQHPRTRGIKLLTNGSLLTEQRTRSLANAGVNEFVISLDGPEPGLHDRLRGKSGLYDNAVNGINALRKTEREMQRPGKISIGVTTVISRTNYRSILDFPALLRELDCDWWAWNPIKDCPSLRLNLEEIKEFHRLGEDVEQKLRDFGITLMVPRTGDGSPMVHIYGSTAAEIEASAQGSYPANINCGVIGNVGFADLESGRLYACPLTVHRDGPYSRAFDAAVEPLEAAWSEHGFRQFRDRFSKETHARCSGCEPAMRLLHQEL